MRIPKQTKLKRRSVPVNESLTWIMTSERVARIGPATRNPRGPVKRWIRRATYEEVREKWEKGVEYSLFEFAQALGYGDWIN